MYVLQWSADSFDTFFSLFNVQTGYGRLDQRSSTGVHGAPYGAPKYHH